MCSRSLSWTYKRITRIHNDYLLAPIKIETKSEMLSEYQLKIDLLHNTSFGNVKKFVSN